MTEPIYLTTIELAQRWKMSPRTLDNWRSSGKGPRYRKVSRRCIQYQLGDVLRYEREQQITPEESEPVPSPESPRARRPNGT